MLIKHGVRARLVSNRRTNLFHHWCELLHGSGVLHGCICRRSRSWDEKGAENATQRVKVLRSLKKKEFPSYVVAAAERRGEPTVPGEVVQQSVGKRRAPHVTLEGGGGSLAVRIDKRCVVVRGTCGFVKGKPVRLRFDACRRFEQLQRKGELGLYMHWAFGLLVLPQYVRSSSSGIQLDEVSNRNKT